MPKLTETVYHLLAAAANRRPEAAAITFLPSLEAEPIRLTHGAFLARLHRIARLFRSLGVGRGDVVTLLAPAVPDAIIALWAAQAVGIAHPVNTLLRTADIAAMMRVAGSRLLVALGPQTALGSQTALGPQAGPDQSELWDKALAAARETPSLRGIVALGAIDPGAGSIHLASSLPADDSALENPPSADDVAAIFHTGGTSGAPKLARLSHANQAFVARSLATAWQLDATTRFVNGLPLFHVGGSIDFTLAPLTGGAEVMIPTATGLRNPAVVAGYWRMVDRFRPTVISGVPTSLGALFDVPTDGADLRSVRLCATGGAFLPRALGEAFTKRFSVPVHQIYGMTECAGLIATANTKTGPLAGTIGSAIPGVEVAAFRLLAGDKIGERLPPDESGVLVVRGPNVFPGYLGEISAPLTEDGWLITGDIGSVDADGLIRITGRAKDVIIRGGHNIDPAVIEDAAASHPQVAASAAIGRPDIYAGEVPMLYVVLRSESAEILADLRAHLERSVPEDPARPKAIVVLPALPMTVVGKLDKVALRRDAAARAAGEALDADPLFIGTCREITVSDAHKGGIMVEVTITAPPETGAALAGAADRLLSGFSFEHKVTLRQVTLRQNGVAT